MPKEKAGRPTVMTKDTIRKLEDAFLDGCSDREACLVADIGPTALYEYCKENPLFAERKELLKKTPTIEARRSVRQAMRENGDLALKYLERKEKAEFSLRQEHTGKDGNAIETKEQSLTEQELQDITAKYEQELRNKLLGIQTMTIQVDTQNPSLTMTNFDIHQEDQ